MALLARAVPLIALLCTLSLAADCGDAGSCFDEMEQTSLVQVKQVVTHGNKRAQPAEAELDSDAGDKTEEQIPVVADGQFVGPAMAASVGGSLGADAAINAASNARIAGAAASQSAVTGALAAEAAAEARPMNPELWPTPITKMKAIADSTPNGLDNGEINSAFGANEIKARDVVVNRAARALEFTGKVAQERKAIKIATAKAIGADRLATAESIAADRRAVAETAVQRMATVGEAVRRVNHAKEEAIAHGIKQRQAQHAAILGRVIGAQEGAAEARLADFEQKKRWAMERAAMVYGKEKRAAVMHRALKRAAINRQTEIKAAELKLLAERSRKQAKAVEIASAANTGLIEDDIEGPEGMNNKLIQHEADRVVKDYERMTGNNKKVLDDLSVGEDRKAVADDFETANLAEIDSAWP